MTFHIQAILAHFGYALLNPAGLWLVQRLLHIWKTRSSDWPQTCWLHSVCDSPVLISFGHAPLNCHNFMAPDWSSSHTCELATDSSYGRFGKSYVWDRYAVFYHTDEILDLSRPKEITLRPERQLVYTRKLDWLPVYPETRPQLFPTGQLEQWEIRKL